MLNSYDCRKLFYHKLVLSPSKISDICWAKGCFSWLTGRYFLLVQKESTVHPGKYCTVIVRGKGLLMSETVIEANLDILRVKELTKYHLGIPSELRDSYPMLSQILRPGSPWNFETDKVTFTFNSDFPANDKVTLNKEREQKVREFMEKMETAIVEIDALRNGNVTPAKTIDKNRKISLISGEDLNLPLTHKIGDITIRYCENRKSEFWGTKNYIFQVSRDGRIFTVYLIPSSLLSDKCKLRAYLRNLDTSTIDILTTVYSTGLPEEFKKSFPVTSAFIEGGNLPGKMTLCADEIDQILDEKFPLDFNRPVPQSALKAIPIFITMALALVNELGNFRRTALYTRLRTIARKKDDAKGNAMMRRLAILGIGMLIGSSFDMLDTDVDTGDSLAADTPDIDETSTDAEDNTDIDAGNSAGVATTPGVSQSMPGFGHTRPGYLISNPFGDPEQMNIMFDMMHSTGQIDDKTYDFIQNMNAQADAEIARHQAITDSLFSNDHEKVRPIIGPSSEDWDRFDGYESTRESAVNAYHDALDRGDLDEADRQADIARDAQRRKEGIYSVQYTPQSIDKRAGLC